MLKPRPTFFQVGPYLFLIGVLKVLGAGEDSLLELMLLVVDMEAMEQLEERSSLLPPLDTEEEDRCPVKTPTSSPVSGFTVMGQTFIGSYSLFYEHM